LLPVQESIIRANLVVELGRNLCSQGFGPLLEGDDDKVIPSAIPQKVLLDVVLG